MDRKLRVIDARRSADGCSAIGPVSGAHAGSLKSWLKRIPGVRTIVDSRRDLMAIRYEVEAARLHSPHAKQAATDAFAEQLLAAPFTAERHWEPPRYWLRWHDGHPTGPTR